MFDLMQALMARELSADRVREAEQYHRRQVKRVRESVLLVPRRHGRDSQEA